MANWRNKINIKQYLKNKSVEDSYVREISLKVYDELKRLLDKENNLIESESKRAMHENYADSDLEELEMIAENFKEISESTEIPEYELEYNGINYTYEDWFNDMLDNLYNLGDTIVFTRSGKEQKFIWVG